MKREQLRLQLPLLIRRCVDQSSKTSYLPSKMLTKLHSTIKVISFSRVCRVTLMDSLQEYNEEAAEGKMTIEHVPNKHIKITIPSGDEEVLDTVVKVTF